MVKKLDSPYLLAIIGSGPAGLTAALYAARARLQPVVFEGSTPGGQLMGTQRVENWPGVVSATGPELMRSLREHARVSGATLDDRTVRAITRQDHFFKLTLSDDETVIVRSVILATGATYRRLGCPGEEQFWGRGVGTCATCDAPLYENKEVLVVGGGNTAVTNALQLARYARHVTIVHLLDRLTATDPIVHQVYGHERISIRYGQTVTAIMGDAERVTHAQLTEVETGMVSMRPTDGVFVAIGMMPNTALVAGLVNRDEQGYILRSEGTTVTSVPGLFAAGDVADFRYRQAITSAGEGCMAALDAEHYLTGQTSVRYSG